MSNSCVLMILIIKKEIEQRFNYMTAKLIKCNVNNEYSSFSAVKNMPKCKRTEEKDKREVKKREEIAFLLN